MRLRTFLIVILGSLLANIAVDAQNAPSLAGKWQGTLVPRQSRGSRDLSQRAIPTRLPTVVTINTASDGTHSGTWASTSQNGITDIGKITIDGDVIRISVPNWRGSWEGTLSADGSTLEGSWTQAGLKSPLVLRKVAQ